MIFKILNFEDDGLPQLFKGDVTVEDEFLHEGSQMLSMSGHDMLTNADSGHMLMLLLL